MCPRRNGHAAILTTHFVAKCILFSHFCNSQKRHRLLIYSGNPFSMRRTAGGRPVGEDHSNLDPELPP